MSAAQSFRVLIVDDTPSIHQDFAKILAPGIPERSSLNDLAAAVFGQSAVPSTPLPAFELTSAYQGEEALTLVEQACAENRPFTLAFVDMRMPPGWDGLETIRHLWSVDPDLQVVICTAYSDHSWSAITQQVGHSDNLLILKKPFDHIEALQLAHALSTKWRITRTNRQHLAELDRTVHQRTYQLASAEARFADAFNASPLPQAIIAHEPRFEFLSINQAFERQLHLTLDALAHSSPENFGRGLDPERWQALIDRILRGEPVDEHPFVYTPPGHGERQIRCSARRILIDDRICSIWVFRDITQQLETELQLRQAQKLEAIGQLSAGVAHDFNNLLTVIHGYTSEVLSFHPDPEVRHLLEPVQAAASRAAALTRQLLIFARKQLMTPEVIDVAFVLEELRPLLRRLIGADIDLQWEIPDSLPHSIADPASLEQVIVNLVVNARDALPQGGRIAIAARARSFTAQDPALPADGKPGDYLEISVKDTGTGIPPEVLSRIFEPFFTTKEPGKGTGLGLATVYSIVRQQGGWVTVDTRVGAGSTFSFYHPLAPTADQPARVASPTNEPVAAFPCFRRVLVAEDDPVVQSLVSAVLQRRGIACNLAADGVLALQAWQADPGAYDLVLSDMVMPGGVSGLRVIEEIRRTNPSIPVILMTGYSEILNDPKCLDRVDGPRPKLLLKPFLPNDLIHAMNEVAPSA